jgi:hypothetical protein
MPAFPEPFEYDWLAFIEPPTAEDDTRPCAAVDESTQPVEPASAPVQDKAREQADALLLDGLAYAMTTVDYYQAETEEVTPSTVGRDRTITVTSDWPPGTPVLVTVQRN